MKITTLTLLTLLGSIAYHPTTAQAKSSAKDSSTYRQSEAGNAAPEASDSNKILEAETHLANLKELFKEKKGLMIVFNMLNGKAPTNDESQRLTDTDRRTNVGRVRCIKDSKWAVTGTGKGQDESAMSWVDADGKSILTQMVDALRKTPEKGVARITYTTSIASPIGGAPISKQITAVVASSSYLMGEKNTSGHKFLCFAEVPH